MDGSMTLTYRIDGFVVHHDGTQMNNRLLEKFRKKNEDPMTRYDDILILEQQLIEERKKLLLDLKEEFTTFAGTEYPEYFL